MTISFQENCMHTNFHIKVYTSVHTKATLFLFLLAMYPIQHNLHSEFRFMSSGFLERIMILNINNFRRDNKKLIDYLKNKTNIIGSTKTNLQF